MAKMGDPPAAVALINQNESPEFDHPPLIIRIVVRMGLQDLLAVLGPEIEDADEGA